MLKKDININNEKITSLTLEFRTNERLLNGKKPPEETIVSAKLNEINDLKSKIFKIIKIKKVKNI